MRENTHNIQEYTVGAISGAVKRVVEDTFGYVRVRGEISGFKRHSSGHLYFDLKDENACLASVCWRGTAGKLGLNPENGMEVVCTGKITTYGNQSKYQLVVERMELAGAGALMALLEKRRQQFIAEGLFDPARKKPLPFMPQVIGVITSPTGAVIRDIIHRITDRFPVHVLVWPVRVQGEGAKEEIAAAIEGFNGLADERMSGLADRETAHPLIRSSTHPIPRPDLLIVARGGGSMEDLWAFNEEVVVRAAAASIIPLISAVGHETDTTLIDFVSDHRAPTPTAAAERAVPVRAELWHYLQETGLRQERGMLRFLSHEEQKLKGLVRGLPRLDALLASVTQRLDELTERMSSTALSNLLKSKTQSLQAYLPRLSPLLLTAPIKRHYENLEQLGMRLEKACAWRAETLANRLDATLRLLESVSYMGVLKRGFALVASSEGQPITSSKLLEKHTRATLRFHDGKTDVTIP